MLKHLTLFVTKLMQEIGNNHVCVDYLFQKSVILCSINELFCVCLFLNMCLSKQFRNGHNILFCVLYFLYHVFVYFWPAALYYRTIKLVNLHGLYLSVDFLGL